MRSRRRTSVPLRRKSPTQKKTSDCCADCIKEKRPWKVYVEDEIIKYKWRKLILNRNQKKPCICYSGPKVGWDFLDKEKQLASDYSVQTKIANCNGRIKIEFISNGDDVKKMLRIEAERKRIREEKERLNQFRNHLTLLKETNKFPFPYLTDLTINEMQRTEVIEGENPPSGIFQLYILRLKDGGIYVGETTLSYPWRIYNHIRGHKPAKCTKNNLLYGQEKWDRNLIHELMEIIQPINKKYTCSHVFEWWLQQEMLTRKISLSCGIAEAGKLPYSRTCETCNKIANENNLPWKS